MHSLLIIVDCDSNIGMGHISRSLTLAKYCLKIGIPVGFKTNDRGSKFILEGLGGKVHLYSDLTVAIIEFKPTFILVDQFNPSSKEIETIRKRRDAKIAALDQYGKRRIDFDFTVNLIMEQSHKEKSPNQQIYEGAHHAIIRETITKAKRERVRFRKNNGKNILVVFGGSNISSNTERIIGELGQLPNQFELSIVLGPLVNNSNRILDKIEALDCNVKTYVNPPNFDTLMAQSDYAITGGGTTCLELCYLGVPVFCLPQVEIESRLCEQLVELGCINKYIDLNSTLDLIHNEALMNLSIKKAQRLIDGSGAKRIIEYFLI